MYLTDNLQAGTLGAKVNVSSLVPAVAVLCDVLCPKVQVDIC